MFERRTLSFFIVQTNTCVQKWTIVFFDNFWLLITYFDKFRFDQEPDRNPLIGQTSSFISWIKCSCFQPRINLNLEDEKKLIYAISKKPLADENPLHFDVLLSLYKLLTGSKLDCPRYGSHWEQIGFQGNDPATDLRGKLKSY